MEMRCWCSHTQKDIKPQSWQTPYHCPACSRC
jgi:hypothetical protein